MVSSPTAGMMNCLECGRLVDVDSNFCQYCGSELPDEEFKKEEERETAAEEKSVLPILGGILIIISSMFIFMTISLVMEQRNALEPTWYSGLIDDWPNWFIVLLAIFGIAGIIGGISSIARASQELAIVGGVLSSFGIGMAIGIVGLVLVAVSENEFRSALSDYTELPGEIEKGAFEKPGFGWRH